MTDSPESIDFAKVDKILELERQIETMYQYLDLKVKQKDLHGIWDSAIEIEKLNGMIAVLTIT
jgi:hypothetical protein